MKKKLLIVLSIIVIFALGAGVGVFAAGTYGTQSDPLITKSYLDTTVSKKVDEEIGDAADDAVSELSGKLDSKISTYRSQENSALGSAGAVPEEDVFTVVTLSEGDTVTCGVGAEIMLRIGSANAWGYDYPAVVDLTTSSSVSAGSSLSENHMYMVTIKGCGIVATSDTVKVLIRGDYTVS